MSASVADILRGAGFVPIVPELSRKGGIAQTQAGSRVPVVPAVPVENDKVAVATASQTAMKCDDATTDRDATRARLLALVDVDYGDPALIWTLGDAFLRDCNGMNDDALRALLSMLTDDAERQAGRVPKADTAMMLCAHCGPVWIHPAIAVQLDVVNGWPTAPGCPWCFVHPKGDMAIPRPSVTCADCQHFQPDSVNPASGCGSCDIGMRMVRGGYPHRPRQCKGFQPRATP